MDKIKFELERERVNILINSLWSTMNRGDLSETAFQDYKEMHDLMAKIREDFDFRR